MSVDKIKAKILADARAEAKKVEDQISGQVRQIEAQQKEQVEVIEKQVQLEAKQRAEDRFKKDIATAELELRKTLLAEKQALIQKIFDQALKRLTKLTGEKYEKFLLELLLKTVETGDEQLIFSTADEHKVKDQFLEKANRLLTEQGKKGELRLVREERDLRGGFILRRGKKEVNCSLGALFSTVREELEPGVAKILFS
ncbi:V-type ATP synthase subunit E [Candidatus Zixiibacteriota bacterium]